MTNLQALAPRRPICRYYGGKWRLAPKIIEHFPGHACYVEPYGGAASVMMRKPISKTEVYNDLDSQVVGLFRILQDTELCDELVRKIEVTPYAREEFDLAWEATDDPIESARRFLIRSDQSYCSGGGAVRNKTGFRAKCDQTERLAREWAKKDQVILAIAQRLRRAVIEHRPALVVIRDFDAADTLFYVDPPYRRGSRLDSSLKYRHELTDQDHRDLLGCLTSVKGMVVISHYPDALYDEHLAGWKRVELKATTNHGQGATEHLWISPNAQGSGLFAT